MALNTTAMMTFSFMVQVDEIFSGLWRLGSITACKIPRILPDIACYGKVNFILTHRITACLDDPLSCGERWWLYRLDCDSIGFRREVVAP